jgi:hypothetical protein
MPSERDIKQWADTYAVMILSFLNQTSRAGLTLRLNEPMHQDLRGIILGRYCRLVNRIDTQRVVVFLRLNLQHRHIERYLDQEVREVPKEAAGQ